MPDYPEEIAPFVTGLYPEDARQHACHASNVAELATHQSEARPILASLIGLNEIQRAAATHNPRFSILDSRSSILDSQSMDGYTRTLCEFESEPNFTIPFHLFVPTSSPGPYPIAILPHGHDREGMDTTAGIAHGDAHRKTIETKDRDVAVQAVERGFLAIAPATRGQSHFGVPDINARHGKRDCRSQFVHAILAGRTAIGERVWDMMRLIDWATARDDTDPSRILVMGNSGGGVVTIYTAAVDERVACAVPSCSFVSLTSTTGFIHHCDCNAVPGIARFGEIWDICALIAPRHLCIVNGRQDKLFPNVEVQRAVDALRPIYQAAGADDRLSHHFGPAGHRFYADLHWPFIEKALNIED